MNLISKGNYNQLYWYKYKDTSITDFLKKNTSVVFQSFIAIVVNNNVVKGRNKFDLNVDMGMTDVVNNYSVFYPYGLSEIDEWWFDFSETFNTIYLYKIPIELKEIDYLAFSPENELNIITQDSTMSDINNWKFIEEIDIDFVIIHNNNDLLFISNEKNKDRNWMSYVLNDDK